MRMPMIGTAAPLKFTIKGQRFPARNASALQSMDRTCLQRPAKGSF
jgi:hypothetical protein